MLTIYDTQTQARHALEGLSGPTPVLLIKDHVRSITDYPLEAQQLIYNANVLSDEASIDIDDSLGKLVYLLLIKNVSVVTGDHVKTLQNLVTQLQTNIEIVTYLEANLKARKITSPPSFMAYLLCEGFRKRMYTDTEAQSFLESNQCILPILTTIKTSPGVLSKPHVRGMRQPGMRQAAPRGGGEGSGAPPQHQITADMFQQALTGALQRTGLVPGAEGTGSNDAAPQAASTLLSQVMAAGRGEQPAGQQAEEGMEGVEQGYSNIQQQMTDRREQLEQLHAMGLVDDVQNIQALQATNGNVEAAIELLFSDL